MNLGLDGKLALVTASTGGLGFACAKALAADGARVAVCGRDQQRVEEAVARLVVSTGGGRAASGGPGAGGGARAASSPGHLGVVADVSRASSLEALFEAVEDAFGGLDVLINNAGGPPAGSFQALDEDAWASAFQLTLLSVVRSVRLAVPLMRGRGGGRVLTIVSSSVKRPIPNLTLSNTFRPAVQGLSKSLSLELAADNIQVNCLAPGRVHTDRVDQLDAAVAARSGRTPEEVRASSLATIPMRRLGDPDEFGRAAAFLSSPAASYINGNTVFVDGGAVDCL